MWFYNLLFNPGVAHSVMLIAFTIAMGLVLSRIKICGVSLGVTWILFVGIIASHFGLVLDPTTSHFVKEFGLILFIYSIGLQVGPGFFASFRKGGITLNLLATGLVFLGGVIAYVIHVVTGEDLYAMIGVLYGAVTNTPGLGAAQQTYSDMHNGVANSIFAQGYAVAYPLGVVGIILSIILIRYIFKINFGQEQKLYEINNKRASEALKAVTLEVTNDAVCGRTIGDIQQLAGRELVATRLQHPGSDDIVLVKSDTVLQQGDRIFLVAKPADVEAYTVLLGRKLEKFTQEQWDSEKHNELVSQRVVVTNAKLQGRRLGDLNIRQTFHVTFTRVQRAGVELIAAPSLIIQLGDRITVVGSKDRVNKVSEMLGNAVSRLDHPQLFSVFLGITLGVILGSLPIVFPGMPVPVKLGLAGGPLIVSILLSYYGPKFHLITYTTNSAKLLMREIGIAMFMAAVGLGAGVGFVDTVMNGGYWWVLYGFIITFLPCIIIGILARIVFKQSYFTIAGMISGATTDPPALAYSNSICGNDQASVAYSTVYPLTMFLRVLCAQLLVLMAL
ncbi:MAG: putative transporter [Bacteroidales bacterium]|nr:putative transporter [Bacteroidales bacterium]MBP5213458.1 putative transporter [Bacteroidales bacterium]